jgi:hypothetical protein
MVTIFYWLVNSQAVPHTTLPQVSQTNHPTMASLETIEHRLGRVEETQHSFASEQEGPVARLIKSQHSLSLLTHRLDQLHHYL